MITLTTCIVVLPVTVVIEAFEEFCCTTTTIPGKVWKCRVNIHFCRRSEDDQAAGKGLH